MFRNLRFTKSKLVRGISLGKRNYSTTPLKNNSSKLFVSGLALGVFGSLGYNLMTPSVSHTSPDHSTLPLDHLSSPVYATLAEMEEAIKEIRQYLAKKSPESDHSLLVNNTKEELDSHTDTYFNTHHASPEERPKYIVYPHLTEEVSEIMKICHKYRVPVVPTGGRSSLEGHFISTRCGITLDLSTMDQILKFNKTDLDIQLQAGVGWEALADYLDEYNLLFSTDPGPGATISGCCANNASGTNASRYGETYKNIINLTVVLADGTIIKTKQRPRKSSAGYNLNTLFVGSEGTLGVITEATVKLHVKPVIESVVVVPFKSILDAANAVNSILLKGIQLNAIELLDDKMMKVINESGETTRKWDENPTLFMKLGGSNEVVIDSLTSQIKSLVSEHNSIAFNFAAGEDEKTELWSARKVALWSTINAGKAKFDDVKLWTTDAAVPISKLPQFLTETKEDIDSHGLKNTLVAHIGDGNAHSFILYRPDEQKTAEKVVERMVKRAIDYEGTCTGEHGVGMGKREFLLEELGPDPVDLMRKVKMAIDPRRILNPDKIFKIDPNEKSEH